MPPKVNIEIQDGGLGVIDADFTGIHAKVGPSSSGTVNEVKLYSDPGKLKTDYGYGPLVEAACIAMLASKKPVLVVRTPSSTAGAAGAVTPARVGTSTGTVAVAGAAYDAYSVKVEILATGTLGTATFRYSLDNGLTWSQEYLVPAAGTFLIPKTNLTLTFAAGAGPTFFQDGDTFTFASTAPASTLAEVQAAIDALLASTEKYEFIHVVGPAATVAAAATMLSAVDARAITAEAAYRYIGMMIEVPTDTDTNIKAAFAAVSSLYTAVGAGMVNYVSAVDSRVMARSVAWMASARAAKAPLGEDLARVRSGSHPFVHSLVRDERVTPGLDVSKFTTATTHVNKAGYYLTNARIFSASGSDFVYWQHRRVMNKAAALTHAVLLDFLNEDLRTKVTDGTINELDARNIEKNLVASLESELLAGARPAVTSVQAAVDRAINLLSTSRVEVTLRIQPRGYAKEITARIGFYNPGLQVAA